MQYNRYTASFINPLHLVIDSNIEVRAELELLQVLTKDGSVTGAFLHVYSLIINVQSSPPQYRPSIDPPPNTAAEVLNMFFLGYIQLPLPRFSNPAVLLPIPRAAVLGGGGQLYLRKKCSALLKDLLLYY